MSSLLHVAFDFAPYLPLGCRQQESRADSPEVNKKDN